MSETCETVKVVTEDGYKIINKSDLKETDKIYSKQIKAQDKADSKLPKNKGK